MRKERNATIHRATNWPTNGLIMEIEKMWKLQMMLQFVFRSRSVRNIKYINTHNGPQAGAKRTREMSLLYGGESILVQTLETKLQMKFDEYADQNQPNLWPSIPLNLSYGS